jgi:hypothetical protein
VSADASALRASVARWADRVSVAAAAETSRRIDAECWVVGHPTDPFDPHQVLAMTTFEQRTDPQLAVRGSFPRAAFYAPGDHKGCQCRFDPLPIRPGPLRRAGETLRSVVLAAAITRSAPAMARRGRTVIVATAPTRSGAPAWWPKALRREWPRALSTAARRTPLV